MPVLPKANRPLTISRFDSALDEFAQGCDLRELKFIDAYGLVGTACALRAAMVVEPGLPIETPRTAVTRAHLTAMGLRDFLVATGRAESLPADPAADALNVVVPLRDAQDAGGPQALSSLLWAQLRDYVDPQVLQAIGEGVWEMVGNALEHSGSAALVMGQVYRSAHGGQPPDHDDRVQVVIGDTGQGIRGSFLATGMKHPADDVEAIELALEYLVTSVPDDVGRGQGLSTTLEQVVGLQGKMVVRSGAAKVSITPAGRQRVVVPRLPGVIVALSLPLYPG